MSTNHDGTLSIEALAARCLDLMADHGDSALEEICRAHPERADELRSVVAELKRCGLLEPEVTKVPRKIGEYTIQRRLGSGGMGAVYLATHDTHTGPVALKVLRHAGGSRSMQRFKREAQALAKVDHPSVCKVVDIGMTGDTPYLAMEYVRGPTLAEDIRRRALATPLQNGPSHTTETLALFEELARAVHVAHATGLVHRDIKPANIIIAEDGRPVLVDFGLVRDETTELSLTITGELVGTPAYMPPEQIRGMPIDHRSDIYSLAASCYEALTHHLPFRNLRRHALYQQILSKAPRDPRHWNSTLSAECVTVLERALSKEPRDRFDTALEFAEELARVRLGVSIRSRRPSVASRLARWARHNRTATGLIAVALIGLATTASLLHRSRSAESRFRALAYVQAAEDVGAEDPMLAFKLTREALRESDEGMVLGHVQHYMSQLRPSKVIRKADSELTQSLVAPDGRHFLLTGPKLAASLHAAEGTLLSEDLPASTLRLQPALFFGDKLAIADDEAVHIYAIGSRPLTHVGTLPSRGTPRAICASTTADTQRLAVVSSAPASSPDGERSINYARIVDLTAQRTLELPPTSTLRCSAATFLPNGNLVACSRIWNRAGRAIRILEGQAARRPGDYIAHSASSADHFFTITRYGALRVYEHTGALLWVYDLLAPRYSSWIVNAEYSTDGRTILASFLDGRIVRCDVANRTIEQIYHVDSGYTTYGGGRYSEDSGVIVSGNWGGVIEVFDQIGAIDRIRGHRAGLTSAYLLSTPHSLLSTSFDGEARIWSRRPWPGVRVFYGHRHPRFATARDGSRVVFTSDRGSVFVCRSDGEIVHEQFHRSGASFVGFDLAERRIIQSRSDDGVRIWSADLQTFQDYQLDVALAPWPPRQLSNGWWALRDGDRRLRMWRPGQSSKLVTAIDEKVTYIATAPKGDYIVTGTWNARRIHVLDIHGQIVWSPQERTGFVNYLTFSRDGEFILAATGDGYAYVWHWPTRELVGRYGPHPNGVTTITLSLDATAIVTGCRDGSLRVFDRLSGECNLIMPGHPAGVLRAEFVDTGQLVTSGGDKTLRWSWLNPDELREQVEALDIDDLTTTERARFPRLRR